MRQAEDQETGGGRVLRRGEGTGRDAVAASGPLSRQKGAALFVVLMTGVVIAVVLAFVTFRGGQNRRRLIAAGFPACIVCNGARRRIVTGGRELLRGQSAVRAFATVRRRRSRPRAVRRH